MILILSMSCGVEQDKSATNETTQVGHSAGCGLESSYASGGEHVEVSWPEAGGERSYFLSLPEDYNPQMPHSIVVGFSGTDWLGADIQGYLDLEQHSEQTIFVYPDPLWRQFDGWGEYGGWVLGPHATPAHGEEDLIFVEQILNTLEAELCIDTQRVFATGHSWGGDMAQVVSCFLGERFRASVPVAANRPYWFEDASGANIECVGFTAVWTMFGVADDHFSWQEYAGAFGDECAEFWLNERNCSGEVEELQFGSDVCYEYLGCEDPVRYCLYGAEYGHQIPWDYYASATMEWFASF